MKARNIVMSVAASAAITVAAVVYAHPGGGGMGGFGPGAMMGGGYGPGAMMGGGYGPGAMMGGGYGHGAMMGGGHGPGADTEAWLAQYKARLRITPEQEGAWQTFTKKSLEQADSMRTAHEAMFASMQDPKLTAPERAALMSTLMQQRSTEMTTSASALKDLYGVLTPEQRAIIDQRPAVGQLRR